MHSRPWFTPVHGPHSIGPFQFMVHFCMRFISVYGPLLSTVHHPQSTTAYGPLQSTFHFNAVHSRPAVHSATFYGRCPLQFTVQSTPIQSIPVIPVHIPFQHTLHSSTLFTTVVQSSSRSHPWSTPVHSTFQSTFHSCLWSTYTVHYSLRFTPVHSLLWFTVHYVLVPHQFTPVNFSWPTPVHFQWLTPVHSPIPNSLPVHFSWSTSVHGPAWCPLWSTIFHSGPLRSNPVNSSWSTPVLVPFQSTPVLRHNLKLQF